MGLLYTNINLAVAYSRIKHCTVKGRPLLLRPETSTLEQPYRM